MKKYRRGGVSPPVLVRKSVPVEQFLDMRQDVFLGLYSLCSPCLCG